jgi:ABC-2 type transport system ATP-binding protein
MAPAIRTSELSKQYRGGQDSLTALSLEVPPGSVFALVGPNGAGKTTTIKILMNLLQASSGRAEVLGRDSRRLAAVDFTRIGYVSENQQMPGWMPVDGLLAYLRPFYPSWDDQLAGDLMKQFGLPGNRKVQHLSRGMWMKAAIVSSLAYRPQLLILDEPFSGLDPMIREDLINGISGGIAGHAGQTTILISSHDLEDVESFATHIAYLDNGRLRFTEDLKALTSRFRQMEVTVDRAADVLHGPAWPAEWLQPIASLSAVRFVDSRYDPDRTNATIHRLFPTATNISAQPMALRAIFVTLARSGRQA